MKALAGRVLALSRLLLVSLRGLVTALVVVFFSYMIGAILVQVAGRYVFDYAIDWTAETATFAQVWMVLLAAGLAMRDNLHVSVDVLTQSLPLPAREFVRITPERILRQTDLLQDLDNALRA